MYPTLTGSKTPTSNSAKAKKIGGGSTACKSPIGSTNNKWGMPPLIKVSLYVSTQKKMGFPIFSF
ncbi:hypothetical protein FTO65_19005 [Bacillus cereus]|nr:hypothetical protein [Bacillus cereus]